MPVPANAARAAVVTLFIGETHAGIGCDAVFNIAQAVGEEEGPRRERLIGGELSRCKRAADDLNSLLEGWGLSKDSVIRDGYTSDLNCVDGK